MATFTVTTTADNGAGSLRAAVLAANAAAGSDIVDFDASVFDGEAADIIRLTGGQIDITGELSIVGGPAGVTITGDSAGDDVADAAGITDVTASGGDLLDDNSRIFEATADLTLDGLILTGGRTGPDNEDGGAVRSSAGVAVNACTVSGNSTGNFYSDGGGISASTLTVSNSTVSGNIAEYSRGADSLHGSSSSKTVLSATTKAVSKTLAAGSPDMK